MVVIRHALSDERVACYQRSGFLFPIDVFTPYEAMTLCSEVLRIHDDGLPGHPAPWVQKTYLLLPSLDELIRDPRLTGPVAAVLGEDLLALSADLFIKTPRSERRITWHQDVNYWQLEPLEVLTAWVALTPATADNGCMRYAPGRHGGRIQHVERPDAANMLSRGQELAVEVRDEEAVDVVLRPGQVSFHHALTPHASGPNLTDGPRVGFAIRYAPTAVRQQAGPPISARLVRGSDTRRHFRLETGPDEPLSENALTEHLRALEPHAATQYSTV